MIGSSRLRVVRLTRRTVEPRIADGFLIYGIDMKHSKSVHGHRRVHAPARGTRMQWLPTYSPQRLRPS